MDPFEELRTYKIPGDKRMQMAFEIYKDLVLAKESSATDMDKVQAMRAKKAFHLTDIFLELYITEYRKT